jgi:phosphatidate cytidylyltransferase
MIPAVVADAWLGGGAFAIMIGLIGLIAAYEWSRIVYAGSNLQFSVLAVAVIAATYLAEYSTTLSTLAIVAFIWSISLFVLPAVRQPLNLYTFLAVPYLAVPLVAIIRLRESADLGFEAILWLFAVVWIGDTMAYVFGKTIGGPKLAPVMSPNKTWAGLAGAVVGGALGSVLVAWGAGIAVALPLVLLGGASGVVGQVGDLFESLAKRRAGVKDSGSIIPGHGGVLDRVDALLFVAVFALLVGVLHVGLHNPAVGLLVW